jgi:hypothetical protein
MSKIRNFKQNRFGHLDLVFGIYQNVPEYPPALLRG